MEVLRRARAPAAMTVPEKEKGLEATRGREKGRDTAVRLREKEATRAAMTTGRERGKEKAEAKSRGNPLEVV
jgi:hypothetical protein